jgi:hypothetical protein
MRFKEFLEERKDKGYAEVSLKDIVRAMGNKYKKLKTGDEIYDLMYDVMNKLVDKKMKMGYSEVGEPNNTDMMDWADNHTPPPDWPEIIKKNDKKLYKSIMDAKGDKKAIDQLGKNIKKWALQTGRWIRDNETAAVVKAIWKK